MGFWFEGFLNFVLILKGRKYRFSIFWFTPPIPTVIRGRLGQTRSLGLPHGARGDRSCDMCAFQGTHEQEAGIMR